MRRITSQARTNVTALLLGLQNLGWIERRNVQIELSLSCLPTANAISTRLSQAGQPLVRTSMLLRADEVMD
jgi:hypothetical protein